MAEVIPLALRGIVPSLNTPFTADDRIDEASLERLVDDCIEAGCAGLLVLAVAGETASLTPGERLLVLRTVMAQSAGRLPVIVGVSDVDLRASHEHAGAARAAGAMGVLWQPPAGQSEAELEAALFAFGEAGPGLVVLQDLDWSGGGLPIELIVGLFERVPAFGAIKIESVRAGPKYTAVLEATAGRLHVSGGWAAMQMLEALARGVHAFMPTGMERVYCAIDRSWREGRIDAARALFDEIVPVLAFANQHIEVSIRFFKHLRRASGVFATERCRPPVAALDRFQLAEAERLAALASRIENQLRSGHARSAG